MEIAYFVLLLAVMGFFVWLMHRQQTLTIEKLSVAQAQAVEKLTAVQDALNNIHILYRQELSNMQAVAQAEFTRLAQVNANTMKERTIRDKLFAQFADQIKIECTQAVGDAAAVALGVVKESVDTGSIEHRAGAGALGG